jgi:hypothetical protein
MLSALQSIIQELQGSLTFFLGWGILFLLIALVVGFRTIRRAVVVIVEVASTLGLIVSMLVVGRIGYEIGLGMKGDATAEAARLMPIAGTAAGFAIGFIIAAIPLSIVFLLAEIAANTRRMWGAGHEG